MRKMMTMKENLQKQGISKEAFNQTSSSHRLRYRGGNPGGDRHQHRCGDHCSQERKTAFVQERRGVEKMFLRDYTLRAVLSDCNPSSLKVNALADLSTDISEVLPFLNTVLKGRQYNQEERSLTVKRGGHFITFWPRQIAMTKLEDENEARVVMEELKKILNETYEKRDQIKPTYTSRPIPRPLEIFKLLPGKEL